jgi:putative transposase
MMMAIRTLKKNLLWIRTFDTVEELRFALLALRDIYDTTWFIQRLNSELPQIRQQQLSAVAMAA